MPHHTIPPPLVAAVVAATILVVAGSIDTHNEEDDTAERALIAVLSAKRIMDGIDLVRSKRRYIKWDWERARRCVFNDYWGSPTPTFNDGMFERTFRVTRLIADRLLQIAAISDPFFTDRTDALGRRGICPKVKLLMSLKLLAYGCSPSAFLAYFQMGETTARQCLTRFALIMSSHPDILEVYLRPLSRSDAKQVTSLHRDVHGVEGMVGCLDCMHVGWKNCPKAWQGQTAGKEKKPTIVLEAMCDHNLFFWHASFGWAGTLNDINIWDRSSLLKAFLDGTWSNQVDFGFEIGGQHFDKLWIMVDGIYPELARFVKTIQEPTTKRSTYYSKWQEGARKDVERAFGVIQRKFQILVHRSEQWYVEEIQTIVVCCVALHNMMVSHRIANDEMEDTSFYDCPTEDEEEHPISQEEEDIDRREAELALHRRIEEEILEDGNAIVSLHMQQRAMPTLNTARLMYAQRRWETLYNDVEHDRLRKAIMVQLEANYKALH
jgi:Plant transposon protein